VEYKNYLLEMNLGKPITKMEYCLDNSELTGQNVDISALDNWFDYCAGYAVIDGSKHLHESYFLSHLASNWLKEYAKSSKDENFFIRIEPWGPHPPYVVTSEYADNVDRKSIKKNPNFDSNIEHRPEFHRDYMEFWKKRMNIPWDKWQKQLGRCHEQIELVEDAMLEVIHTLKDLNLLDDCVIFVSADHGDALASNGGVANKGSLAVQETIRIPMGIRLGERENAGISFTKPVTNMDIFPTILDIAGVEYGDDIQGRSLKEAIQCRGDGFEEVAYLHHYGMVNKDVQRILVSEKYKYVIQSDGFEELYDIKNDNSELYNIVNENESEVIKMRKLMLEKMTRYNDDYKEAVEIKCILKEKLN